MQASDAGTLALPGLKKSCSERAARSTHSKYLHSFDRKAEGCAIRSRQTERKLRPLAPDYVLYYSVSFAPVWTAKQRFGMYLDYTTAQAARDWPPWAALKSSALSAVAFVRHRKSSSAPMTRSLICPLRRHRVRVSEFLEVS
jgi:hypothetical protein